MSAALDKLLMRVAQDVFEEVASMVPLPGGEARDFGVEGTAASVSFEGHFQGRLVISVCGQMFSALATNMLGLEGELGPTLTQKDDALKELSNVVCGRLLPAISGSQAEFHVAALALSESDFPGKPANGIRISKKGAKGGACLVGEMDVVTVHYSRGRGAL